MACDRRTALLKFARIWSYRLWWSVTYVEWLRLLGQSRCQQLEQSRCQQRRVCVLTFRAFSRLYDRTGGELRLKRSEEVYRSPSYYDGPYKTVLVIWKIAPGDLDE
jgi:hypothetical protein